MLLLRRGQRETVGGLVGVSISLGGHVKATFRTLHDARWTWRSGMEKEEEGEEREDIKEAKERRASR